MGSVSDFRTGTVPSHDAGSVHFLYLFRTRDGNSSLLGHSVLPRHDESPVADD